MAQQNNNILLRFFSNTFKVWVDELRQIFSDGGVVLFFLILPLAYPLIYAAIYDPEMATDVKAVVVDDSRSKESTNMVRALDASQYVKIVDYCHNLNEARAAMARKECYAIYYFPADFSRCVGRGEQAHLNVYCDMSLLYRYKSVLMATTEVTQALSGEQQAEKLAFAISYMDREGAPIVNEEIAIGNPARGMASAIMPGVLVLILQQSMLLGILMLFAGRRERRLKGLHCDFVGGFASETLGRALCYVTFYLAPTIYVLFLVPIIFTFPQHGSFLEIMAMTVPFLTATALLGIILGRFIREREDVFPLIVFSSIAFIFLSGITWPRYAMPHYWQLIGDCIPSTWAVNTYVAMKSNAAALVSQKSQYFSMWALAGAYLLIHVAIGLLYKYRKR